LIGFFPHRVDEDDIDDLMKCERMKRSENVVRRKKRKAGREEK
jgi:hypothetical protein